MIEGPKSVDAALPPGAVLVGAKKTEKLKVPNG
jgi:hypothetical protein